MKIYCHFIGLSLFSVMLSHGALMSTNLYAVQDATLYSSADGSVAGGGDDRLFVGRNGINGLLRSLLQFDVSSHAIKFGSRTHVSGQPVLQVTYESVIPEPQVVGILLVGSFSRYRTVGKYGFSRRQGFMM